MAATFQNLFCSTRFSSYQSRPFRLIRTNLFQFDKNTTSCWSWNRWKKLFTLRTRTSNDYLSLVLVCSTTACIPTTDFNALSRNTRMTIRSLFVCVLVMTGGWKRTVFLIWPKGPTFYNDIVSDDGREDISLIRFKVPVVGIVDCIKEKTIKKKNRKRITEKQIDRLLAKLRTRTHRGGSYLLKN